MLLPWVDFWGVHRSPEAVAEAVVEAYYTNDANTYVKCHPDFWAVERADWYGCPVEELTDEMEEYLEEVSEDYDEYELIRVRLMDQREGTEGLNAMIVKDASRDGSSEITGWGKVSVRFKLDVDGETESMTIYCICLDGSWYVLTF